MIKKAILIEIFIWIVVITIATLCALHIHYKVRIEPNIYNVQFKDIDGITKGSPVRFMGINVGYVRKLMSKDDFVNVQILINKKGVELPHGTTAKVEFYGLGASKSIELMPPDNSCDVGIITEDTVRIFDVAHSVKSFTEVLEAIERYVKSLDKAGMYNFLKTVENIKNEDIKETHQEINKTQININKKLEKINEQENKTNSEINKLNKNVEKINKFLKK